MKTTFTGLLMGFFLSMVFTHVVSAQSFKLHAEYRNDWYGPGYDLLEDIPGYPSVTLQAESINDQFVIEADNSYNKWRKFPASNSNLNQVENYALFAGVGITDNFLEDSTLQDYYYTTRIKNIGYNSTEAIVMATQNMPVNFDTLNPVTQLPLANNVTAGIAVDVTVTLLNQRSPEENVFIRYTIDNWLTSVKVPVYFFVPTATQGNATIPGFSAGTQVSYYAFTTTLDSASVQSADVDLVTLRYTTNQGQNYNYTVGPAPGAACNVVFSVNMSGQTVSPQGVFLAGTFNGFSTTSNPMTLTANNIYVDTVALDTTLTVQYKFVNGSGASAAYELVPISCGLDDGFGNINRNLFVPEQTSSALPVVCFNLCDNSCAPFLVNVVFQVDMSMVTVSPQGVFLAGSFNAWDSIANPMQSLGNGIYVDTVAIDTASVVEYKFLNGNSFVGQETVPSVCGVADGFGGFNRSLGVPETDSTLAVVCFSACSACGPVGIDASFHSDMTVYPNPAHEMLEMKGVSQVEIVQLNGQVLMRLNGLNPLVLNRISIADLPAGIYLLRMQGSVSKVEKLVKQ